MTPVGQTVWVSKVKTSHVCSECGTHHPKWTGQCTGCGEWNTLTEEVISTGLSVDASSVSAPRTRSVDARPPVALDDTTTDTGSARPTGIGELDHVLSGGLVDGSVTLLGGEPGIGKSTLLLQVAHQWDGSVLYVCAEESAQQVRQRAERLGAKRPNIWLLAEHGLGEIADAIDSTKPSLIIVDSIQMISDPVVTSAPGSVAQVRATAQFLVNLAKRQSIPLVLVGHVTKEGDLAGPRVLEHLVDTVLSFEGDRHHSLRLVRAVKHRFGSTNELSVFEMTGDGLTGVADPSQLLLADRKEQIPGSAVVPTLEGRRPLIVELQALTSVAPPGVPARRTAQGIDQSRLAMLLAVLARHCGVPTAATDVYASAVGGVRIAEPGIDLALILAIASSIIDRPLPPDLAVFGEVGLGSEVRQVAQPDRRFAEAYRLGFKRVIAPLRSPDPVDGIELIRVGDVGEALQAAGLT